jgi:hypothetical protein
VTKLLVSAAGTGYVRSGLLGPAIERRKSGLDAPRREEKAFAGVVGIVPGEGVQSSVS